LVVGSLAGRDVGAGDVAGIVAFIDAGAACKSANDQGHGAQRSVGPGGGLAAWGRRALERGGRETSGSLEQWKRPALWVGRRPPGPGPERPKGSERGTDMDAGDDGPRSQALAHE